MKNFALAFASAVILAAASCNTGIETDYPQTLVVEGNIDSDGYPTVMVSKSISPGNQSEIGIEEALIRFAKVTISVDGKEYIMTGTYDKNYFPPFVYKNFDIKGIPGKTYHIKVEWQGNIAEASCLMPSAPAIQDVETKEIAGNDTLRQMSVTVIPEDSVSFYHIRTGIKHKISVALPAFTGAVKVEGKQPVKIPIFAPKTSFRTDKSKFTPQFRVGDTVLVKVCHVTKEVYEFWHDYDNNLTFGGSPLVSANNNLLGNVQNAYGVFSASGTAQAIVIVK